jgi:hypothetical protein
MRGEIGEGLERTTLSVVVIAADEEAYGGWEYKGFHWEYSYY